VPLLVMTVVVLMKMARFSRRLHPVNTIKHIVDRQGGLTVDTQAAEQLAVTVDDPATASSNEVNVGSHINGIYLNVQCAATSTAALANIYMIVVKNPGNNITFPKGNVVGGSDERKFVIHQEMIMTEKNTTAIPRTLFKGVLKIPGSYSRMGIKDRIQIYLLSPGVTYDYCVQCIYKEIR